MVDKYHLISDLSGAIASFQRIEDSGEMVGYELVAAINKLLKYDVDMTLFELLEIFKQVIPASVKKHELFI